MRAPGKQIFQISPAQAKVCVCPRRFGCLRGLFGSRRRQHRDFLLFGNRTVCLDSFTGLVMERYLFVCWVYIRWLRAGPITGRDARFLGALDKSCYDCQRTSIGGALRTSTYSYGRTAGAQCRREEASRSCAERKRSAIQASANSGKYRQLGVEPG